MDARMQSILEQKGIHADRDGLHLLPPDQLAQSQQLQSETKEFLEKTKAFNEIVADFITVMEGKSKARPPTAPQPNTRTGRRPDTHTDTHTHTDARAHTGPEADTGARPISRRAAALASPALALYPEPGDRGVALAPAPARALPLPLAPTR